MTETFNLVAYSVIVVCVVIWLVIKLITYFKDRK